MIAPNREGLKFLSDFNIDAQFAAQSGSQVFNYNGEETDKYKEACASLSALVADIEVDLANLKKQIPVFK